MRIGNVWSACQKRPERRRCDQKPRDAEDDHRDEDRCAAEVLGASAQGVKLGADAVHNRLNGGVEDLDEHQEKDGADEEHRLDGG